MEISQSRYKKVISTIANCKALFRTTDPFKICELMGFKICFVALKSNLYGFADVKSVCMDSLNTQHNQLNSVNATIYISSLLDSYSKKIVCAHELGHVLLQGKEELNLLECTTETLSIKEYEANLFAIELLPQIYHNTSADYRSLSKKEMQMFMNKKISCSTFAL